MKVKDIIKNKRKELGLTMLDVAKACEVSEATVSRWESGDIGDMKRSRISSLAKILNISPAIIVGTDDEEYDQYEEHLKDKPELLELYQKINNNEQMLLLFDKTKDLTPQDMEQVLKIIDTFNKETM